MAPRWFRKGQAPSGWRPGGSGEGRRPAFLPMVACDLFNINDDDDDANARSNLAMQLELQNQSKSTILE